MENRKTKLAIVGIFWDGFYDLWEDFLELKEMFWKDCPYPLYIVNQTKELKFDKKYDVTVLHAGEDAEYSRKVQLAVNEIDADYLLLLLDDFFFSKELNGDVLETALDFIKNNAIDYYCMPLYEFQVGKPGKKSEIPFQIKENDEYTLSCQPTIWERNFLAKCIGTGNYNAWIFEGIYATSKEAHTYEFLKRCMTANNNPLRLLHGALQGQMVPDTIKYFNSISYDMHNRRETMPFNVYRLHQYKSALKGFIPLIFQRIIKKVFNVDSVYGRYSKAIAEEMNRMGIK